MDLTVFLVELRDFIKRGIYTINGIQVDGISDGELLVYRDLFADLGIDKICILLDKVMSLNINNLEMELLTLGYTGLVSSTTTNTEVTVPKIENEVAKEEKNATVVIKEKEQKDYEQGVENANNLMESVSVEDLLGLGGSFVE